MGKVNRDLNRNVILITESIDRIVIESMLVESTNLAIANVTIGL